MKPLDELLDSNQWVYWLNQSKPPETPGSDRYMVSLVFENERGHFPTGGGGTDPLKSPWYWNEDTCREMNRRRGFSEEEVARIVSSSMML